MAGSVRRSRAVDVLDRIEEIIVIVMIAGATMVIFVSVVHRYGLSNLGQFVVWAKANDYTSVEQSARGIFHALNSIRLTWAQELCIFMFIWMAKFGAAYGVRTGIHVGVDILVNAMSEPWRHIVILFGLLGGVVFTGFIGWLGAELVFHLFNTEQVSAVLEAPMWIVYLCLPLGSFLMCFRFMQVAWRFHKTGQLPKHDIAHVAGLDASEAGGAR
jgi:C4-dicarboxylate transporter, DctQ subunit